MAKPGRARLARPRYRLAVAAVLLLWLMYATLQTLLTLGYVGAGWFAVISFVPGALAVLVLLAAGFSRKDCYLRWARLSGQGLAVLVAVFAFALAAIVPFGVWRGWDWVSALVLAPASGVSQELFFRAAMLPAMMIVFPRRPAPALLCHSIFFSLWHIGPLFGDAPLGIVLAILFVPFLCGIGWGWQVRRDGTVLWAMAQHSLIWVIGFQFEYG